MRKVGKHKDFDLNHELLEAQMMEYQRELWENNRFCSCDADNIYECECSPKKKKRFRRRRKRKINQKFSRELDNMLAGRLPHHDTRKGKPGYPYTDEEGEASEQ